MPGIGDTRNPVDSTNTLINAEQQVILSSGIEEANHPIDNLTIFNRNTHEIFVTFYIYDNRDSDTATVTWFHEQAEIASFEIGIFIGYGETTSQTFYSLLTSPSGGFKQGIYYVVAHINDIELAKASFYVE
jgi:hypothetical protein